jgi:peptidoglycan/LPS O-acetylase OafA/YrhL
MDRDQALSPAFSLYLDLVRFAAAAAVFLDHLSSYPFSTGREGHRHGLALVGSYGPSAVVVFFVLSGFVIAYVTDTREQTAKAYMASRVSRLYSVILPALLLTFAFDSAGQWLRPEFYEIQKVMWRPPSLVSYGASLALVTEYQVFHFGGIVPGSNSPYWSLSFEATYYLLAGLLLFAPRRFSIPLTLIVLALAGRTITAMAPLWALGFWLYHARRALVPRLPAAPYAWGGSAVLILALPFLIGRLHWNNLGVMFPWGRGPFNRDLLLDYALAAAFAVNMVAAQRMLADGGPILERLARPLRWLGGLTFPLYAIHYPLLCFFAAISPWDRASPLSVAFVAAAVLTIVVVVTPVCDGLKLALRHRLAAPAPARAAG